jgi:hypothetical protein
MAIIDYLRKMFRKNHSQPDLEYVQNPSAASPVVENQPPVPVDRSWEMEEEIDLSHQADLEGYARDLNVSKESIERWISSGLLMPEELKVAEKLVKIMRNH